MMAEVLSSVTSVIFCQIIRRHVPQSLPPEPHIKQDTVVLVYNILWLPVALASMLSLKIVQSQQICWTFESAITARLRHFIFPSINQSILTIHDMEKLTPIFMNEICILLVHFLMCSFPNNRQLLYNKIGFIHIQIKMYLSDIYSLAIFILLFLDS
jgi:hypothetical protein